MRFGPVPTAAALGAVLAHSVGLTGGRLRKGHVLTCEDLSRLRSDGITTVTVAQLDPGDQSEDAAALHLAEALVQGNDGLRLSVVGTGRVNIHATGAGILRLAAESIALVNAVDPMITVATLPPLARVQADEMVATVKIIAYAVPADHVAQAARAGAGAIGIAGPVLTAASFIETVIGDGLGDKGWRVTNDRLARLGVALEPAVEVPHRTDELAAAIASAPSDLILILTGSATSDPHDVGPAALRQAGGEVIRFGMPVDPGNLLFFGRLGRKWVIGLPGCARSPALNGADWILERVICGLPPSSADIAAMGVGGLLKEIPTRPRPRGA
jgi:molybdenum cofactor cytidylyltransferase